MDVRAFCRALASKSPTPGGGAVAGVTAAHAAALIAMVVEYSRGKGSFAAFESETDAILGRLHGHVEQALASARADAEAFAALSSLWRKPAADPERTSRWESAVEAAIAAPDAIVRLAVDLSARCRELAGHTAKHLDSDLAIAADLAGCAARAAAWNVRANLPSIANADRRIAIERDLDERLAIVRDHVASTERLIASRP